MDLGSLRKSIGNKARVRKNKGITGKKILNRKVDVGDRGAEIKGSDYLLLNLTDWISSTKNKIKLFLIVIGLIAFTWATWRYLGWYTSVSFYISLATVYGYLRFIKSVPVRILQLYDPDVSNEISIKAIPVKKWIQLEKKGVQNYHTTRSGIPFYVARKIEGDTIFFTWFQDHTFNDFWAKEKILSKLAKELDDLWIQHFENLHIPQLKGYRLGREYLTAEHRILDKIMTGRSLDESDRLDGISEELERSGSDE